MATTDIERYRQTVMKSNLYDKEYVALVFGGRQRVRLSQFILRLILDREDIKVRSAHVEDTVTNLLGRGIRMDVVSVGRSASTYDLEFQRDVYGASPQRARFNASVIDANYDLKGTDPRRLHLHLPETYVIFITETDVLGEGRPIYHVERTVVESDRLFNDGSHIIYVNGAYDGIDTPLGRMIHDFRCVRADDMLLPELAARTRELKETAKGAREMSARWDTLFKDMRTEFYNEGRDAGRKEGRREGRKEGRNEGRNEGVLTTLFGLVGKGRLTLAEASEEASMPEAVFKAKMAEYQGGDA